MRVADRRESSVEADEGSYQFSLLSRSQHASDAEVFTITLSAGASIPAKGVHHGYESLFVLEGEIQIEVGERVFNLREGDYLEFPGAYAHCTSSKTPTATILVMVRT